MHKTNGIFRSLEAKRSIMSLTYPGVYVSVNVHHGWGSQTLFSHRVSNPWLQPPKCGERLLTRLYGQWICHKDLEKPICVGTKLWISPGHGVGPGITARRHIMHRGCADWLHQSRTGSALCSSSGHVQNKTWTKSKLVARPLMSQRYLFTDFNNLKQKSLF